MLEIVIVPVVLPVAPGLKVTLRLPVWFGVRTVPALIPVAPYPAPATETPEIVTF